MYVNMVLGLLIVGTVNCVTSKNVCFDWLEMDLVQYAKLPVNNWLKLQ